MEVYLHAPSVFMCEDLQNQFHKNCRLILCNYMSLKRTVMSSKNILVSSSKDQSLSVSKMQSKNLQLLCFHTATHYSAQATVSILQCNHRVLTVSQLRHLVSLVRIPWKISCTHVGSG
jgi:hypothetical protein